MSRANDPAHPLDLNMPLPNGIADPTGLTIREHFAAMAMQGLLAHHGDSEAYSTIARWSAAYSDALIAELAKPTRHDQLVAAVNELLPEVDSEIDQRKLGGNDEDWLNLQRLVDNVREAMP